MLGTTLCGPGTLVHQTEELGDILYVMCGKLLQHLFIPHTLQECNYNRCIGNMRDSVANLGEPLDEGAQRFPRALLHCMKVGLVTWSRVSTLKVGRELAA
jgi:hypothetical protein